MSRVVIGRTSDAHMTPELIDGMFRLRHRVFRELLGWDVESHDGRERDRFDALDPVYIVAHDEDRQEVVGCWRLIPTTGPYMLRDVFPQLLRGGSAPRDPHIWEVSRFATALGARGGSQADFGPVALQMIWKAVDFCLQNDVQSFITATSVDLERRWHAVGVPTKRLGDGQVELLGNVPSVACWVDVGEEMLRFLEIKSGVRPERIKGHSPGGGSSGSG
ncbi:acyl-homoserine-lactone synthase [Stigmatella sp. ncwal1]|uniref:Acyl-homoserine-lactone synthase n=1 Tax=Stigmatella ashevillensis TaxID=2995309 RepID=A0ABT5DCV0_9BACT|nr:acyl-homoserine-lactone synthase [Stigmatella ashevillena]MDC0710859.1 acyl-homoserine-lactone synthase [Stigmatella ashevillena]